MSEVCHIHGFIVIFFRCSLIVFVWWVHGHLCCFVCMYRSKCKVSSDWSIHDDRMFSSSRPIKRQYVFAPMYVHNITKMAVRPSHELYGLMHTYWYNNMEFFILYFKGLTYIISIKWCIIVPENCVYLSEHFIWVLTVCQSSFYEMVYAIIVWTSRSNLLHENRFCALTTTESRAKI